jgi:hypothetical protein
MYQQISECRICKNKELVEVLDLGAQTLTGVFPKTRGQQITAGPLKLVKCTGDGNVCGLLQLQHTYDLGEMYGDNYGYRSGLNASMVAHLHGKVRRILERMILPEDALIVDIGANDSTTLQAYPVMPATPCRKPARAVRRGARCAAGATAPPRASGQSRVSHRIIGGQQALGARRLALTVASARCRSFDCLRLDSAQRRDKISSDCGPTWRERGAHAPFRTGRPPQRISRVATSASAALPEAPRSLQRRERAVAQPRLDLATMLVPGSRLRSSDRTAIVHSTRPVPAWRARGRASA